MLTKAQVLKTDATIVANRVANGGHSDKVCPICCRPVARPYRCYNVGGNLVQGCIDASHSAALANEKSLSARWHFGQARKYRKMEAR